MHITPFIRSNYRKLFHILISKQCRNFFSTSYVLDFAHFKSNKFKSVNKSNVNHLLIAPVKFNVLINEKRNYSKKKKSSKESVESDEESDSEEEDNFESLESDEVGDGVNVISKAVPSMRLDTIVKATFGITKKKIEKEFYACNLRLNGEKALKKAMTVSEGDEIDLVKDVSPDNDHFLVVDRAIIMSIGKLTGSGKFPLKLQVFKKLIIPNYSDPWKKSTINEND